MLYVWQMPKIQSFLKKKRKMFLSPAENQYICKPKRF